MSVESPSGGAADRGRRSLSNFWVRPETQARLILYTFGLLMISIVLGFSGGVLATAAASPEGSPESARTMALMLCGSMAGLATLAMIVSYLFIQRIVGPLVPIERLVDELKSGRYSGRVQLRKADEFQDLATKLNELAERLENKTSRSTGS